LSKVVPDHFYPSCAVMVCLDIHFHRRRNKRHFSFTESSLQAMSDKTHYVN
jgi:hypothetical protein